MKILLSENNIVGYGVDIVKGIFDEPNIEKWAVYKEDGSLDFYVLDNGFTTADVDGLPSDFDFGKYLYVDGEIVDNPDYEEPPKPVEEVVEELAESMEETETIVDTVLSDILPSHNTSISELEDMIDFLLTEILPNRV